MTLHAIDISLVVSYLIVTLAIGLVAGKNIKTFREYATSNYKFADSSLFASIIATWVGADVILGITEKVYAEGMIWVAILLAGAIAEMLVFNQLSSKIYRFKGCLTPGEIMGICYNSHTIRVITGLCVAFLSIGTIGVQIAALGMLTDMFFGLPPYMGMVICSLVVIVYSSVGGIKAVVYTDIIQFGLIIIAIPLMAMLLVQLLGGMPVIIEKLPSAHTHIFPEASERSRYLLLLFLFAIPYADPCLIQRVLISKSSKQAAYTFKVSIGVFAVLYPILGIIALTALASKTGLDPKAAFYYLIDTYLPTIGKGIAITIIVAIIMSTTDSWLNVASISIVHDVIHPLALGTLNDKKKLRLIKLVTLVVGLASILFSMSADSIIGLLVQSYALWGPIMVIPLFAAIIGVPTNVKIFIVSAVSSILISSGYIATLGAPAIFVGTIINLFVFTSITVFYYKLYPEKLYSTNLPEPIGDNSVTELLSP